MTLLAVLPMAAAAQTAFDAYQISTSDMRGTARFMSMGGAFTALGGDLSVLGQNPAGIGVYKNSEIGITMLIDIQSAKANTDLGTVTTNQTKVNVPNAGYIGSIYLSPVSPLRYFNWGISYGRVTSFNRAYRGVAGANTSLSNYTAGYTAAEEWTTSDLSAYSSYYDPYRDGQAPWMSVLLYNSYAINPSTMKSTDYRGLYNGTPGEATFDVLEKGFIDEFNIDFGGNVLDMVYWGLGFNINNVEYSNSTYYTENFSEACIASPDAESRTVGSANWGLESWRRIYGNGFKFKLGVIVKPINEFRIGFAFHTPTWYRLNYDGWAQTQYVYSYNTLGSKDLKGTYPTGSDYKTDDYFQFKLRSPWRIMAGAAGVIAQRAILSVDYEYRTYGSMAVQDRSGVEYQGDREDINAYYKGQHIVRAGAEFRLTQNFSLRAGYTYESSPVQNLAKEGSLMAYTSGPDNTQTQPSYIFDTSMRYITAGIGWHYGRFYVDAAYVNKCRKTDWHAFTNFDDGEGWTRAPMAHITNNDNQIVLSAGFKF